MVAAELKFLNNEDILCQDCFLQKTTHFSVWMNAILSTRNLYCVSNFCAEKSYKAFSCIQKSKQTMHFSAW